jgi:AraC-like DNA-binding protein
MGESYWDLNKEAIARQVDQRGVVVLDNVCGMPIYNEAFISKSVTIGLNLSGWLRAEYDMRSIEVCQHDISVVYPDHIMMVKESSDDYRVMLIIISPRYFEQLKRINPLGYQVNLSYHYQTHFQLNNEQFEQQLSLFRLMQHVAKSDNPRRVDLINHLLELIFVFLQEYKQDKGEVVRTPSAQEALFASFHDAVARYYTSSREVQFYADMFNMTPKRFSSVIKHLTGVSALNWIGDFVIVQAKSLLHNHRQLTIQQVAQRLGFSDHTSFSRYFKHYTGMSPKAFRS